MTRLVDSRGFEYDPQTGEIFRRVDGALKKMGRVMSEGYIRLDYEKKGIYAHRMAWEIFYGSPPSGQIDHINGIRSDNRIDNLRDVPVSENRKNVALSARNKTGHVGVHLIKSRYVAKIKIRKKDIRLGTFDTLELAIAARKEAERRYGFHENHGRKATFVR